MIRPRSLAVRPRRAGLLPRAAFLILILLPVGLRSQSTGDSQAASRSQGGPGAATCAAAYEGPASSGNSPSAAAASAAPSETALPLTQPQPQPYPDPSSAFGVQGLQAPTLAPGAFGENPAGIPYSSIFTPTGADYNNSSVLFGDPLRSGYSDETKLGGAQGTFNFQAGGGAPVLPLIRPGTEPENADIKAGPFFIKFHSLDGLILYSDNYTLSQNDRKSEVLVLLGLNLSVLAQVSENLQFTVSGSIFYLPLQNQFGIDAGDSGDLGLLLFSAPLFGAQIAYDTILAGWPVRFADDFRVGSGFYSDSVTDNFDLFNNDYLERDDNGRYTFRASRSNLREDDVKAENSNVVYFSNTVSALTDRLLPGDVRLTVRVLREDLWYNQDTRGLPNSRDDLYASLVSERENERFKPYISYEASYEQDITGLTQIVRAGVFGPIDDQLFLQAETGYYTQQSHQNLLYFVSLTHDAGPYTTEVLSLDRSLTSFDQEQRTSESYRLNQILGPALVGGLFLAHSSYQELYDDGVSSRDEDIGGVEVAWTLGPKTTLQLAGIFERQNYSSGYRDDTVTGRLILTRIVTDTLTFRILYQYQRVSSHQYGESYFDNIAYLQMIKLF